MSNTFDLAVTLYSFSSEYITGEFSLEDCLKQAKNMGYKAIELVASQMIPGYPYPSDEWIDEFKILLSKYDLEPLCYSAYIDMGTRTDRDMTADEIFQFTLNDMIYAKKMGFEFVRTQHAISPEIFEKMLPYCKQIGVKLAIEMHEPHNPEVAVWKKFIEIMKNSDGYLGVVPDFSIFSYAPHDLEVIQAVEDYGCRQEKVDAIISNFYGEKDINALNNLDLSDNEMNFAKEIFKKYSEPNLEWLELLIPISFYMHGKYWYLKDENDDSGIPYGDIINVLNKNNYAGYVACEYEGHHYSDKIDSIDQLKKFVAMMNK